jgi:hypothetical protein
VQSYLVAGQIIIYTVLDSALASLKKKFQIPMDLSMDPAESLEVRKSNFEGLQSQSLDTVYIRMQP